MKDCIRNTNNSFTIENRSNIIRCDTFLTKIARFSAWFRKTLPRFAKGREGSSGDRTALCGANDSRLKSPSQFPPQTMHCCWDCCRLGSFFWLRRWLWGSFLWSTYLPSASCRARPTRCRGRRWWRCLEWGIAVHLSSSLLNLDDFIGPAIPKYSRISSIFASLGRLRTVTSTSSWLLGLFVFDYGYIII